MEWTPEAKGKMEEMLADIPVMFRKMAERQGTLEAERLAQKSGLNIIGLREMMVGYISATPRFMRDNLKKAMIDHGLDPEEYKAEFETL